MTSRLLKPAMKSLVTRFHLLVLTVTVAITVVAYLRVPADFAFPAHWTRSTADWLWPRDTLLAAPLLQLGFIAFFFVLGRLLTRNHLAKVQHILDPGLTLLLTVAASCQLGLLLIGIGSDLDFIRMTGFGLGATLVLLAVVLFDARRHTYAGLRMPWPIRSDRAWALVHRATAVALAAAGVGLLAAAWFDAGPAVLVLGFAAAMLAPVLLAAILSLLFGAR